MEKNSQIQKEYWHKEHTDRRSIDHPAVKAFFKDKAEALKVLLPSEKINSILDCGCGNGFFQTYLSQIFCKELVGLDFSNVMLDLNPNKEKICASVLDIPCKNSSFNLVVCHGLLHHLNEESRLRALLEMKRVSSKYIFIGEPNLDNLLIRVNALLNSEERMTLSLSYKRLESLARECDLKIIKMFKRGVIMPNKTPLIILPLLKRLEGSWFSSSYGHCTYMLLEKKST